MFIIHTNVEPYKYIVVANNNKMSLTTDVEKATIFDFEKTVQNIVTYNLNSKKNKVHTYTYSTIEQLGLEPANKTMSTPVMDSKHKMNLIKKDSDFKGLNSLLSEVQYISDYATKAQAKLEQLIRNLSNVDKACIDLDHYMELNNLSASEGFKVYKTKQKILKIRRKIKNEIFAYQQILAPLKQYTNGHVERSIAGLKTQEYSPRIMNKLFNRENNL